MKKPRFDEISLQQRDELFDYLDTMSRTMNMNGAMPLVKQWCHDREIACDRREARRLLNIWMNRKEKHNG